LTARAGAAPRPENGQQRAGGTRYSRFVTAMKVVLPALAVGLIGVVVLWPRLQEQAAGFRLGFSGGGGGTASRPELVNARYLGTDDNKRSYTVTADKADQVGNDGALVSLSAPKGDIALNNDGWMIVDARSGLYNKDTKTLDLMGKVTLYHDKGYEVHTPYARVHLDARRAEGDRETRAQGPFGRARGEGFRVRDRGNTVIFTGKSHVLLHADTGGGGS